MNLINLFHWDSVLSQWLKIVINIPVMEAIYAQSDKKVLTAIPAIVAEGRTVNILPDIKAPVLIISPWIACIGLSIFEFIIFNRYPFPGVFNIVTKILLVPIEFPQVLTDFTLMVPEFTPALIVIVLSLIAPTKCHPEGRVHK